MRYWARVDEAVEEVLDYVWAYGYCSDYAFYCICYDWDVCPFDVDDELCFY